MPTGSIGVERLRLTLVVDGLYRLQPATIPSSRTPIGVQDRLLIGAQRIDLELPDQQLDDVFYHHVPCWKMDPSQMGLAMRKL